MQAKESISNFTTAQLLAAIIRGGDGSSIAERCLEYCSDDLAKLRSINGHDIEGLGSSRIQSIAAALELGRRYRYLHAMNITKIKQPADIARVMMPILEDLDQEELWILCLDTKNQIIDKKMIYRGTVKSSAVSPREIYKYALEAGAVNIIAVHNHPSGVTNPSHQDIKVTRRIVEAGNMIEISLADHVIIGHGSYLSFKEDELL